MNEETLIVWGSASSVVFLAILLSVITQFLTGKEKKRKIVEDDDASFFLNNEWISSKSSSKNKKNRTFRAKLMQNFAPFSNKATVDDGRIVYQNFSVDI
jgi:hypothetical protein